MSRRRRPRVVVMPWPVVLARLVLHTAGWLLLIASSPVWGPVLGLARRRSALRAARAAAEAEGFPLPPRQTVAGRVWRRRRQLAPVPVSVLLGLTAASWGPATWPAVAGWLVLAGLWVRACDRYRWHASAVVLAGAGWLTAAGTVLDLRRAVLLLVLATAAAVAARVWRYRVTPAPPTDTSVQDTWSLLGGLAGSTVVDVAPALTEQGQPIGIRLDVDLVPAKQTIDHARQARSLIASAYGLDRADVVIAKTGRSESRIRVTLLDHDAAGHPLTEPVEFGAPTLDLATGTYVHGIRTDRTPALVQLWSDTEGARMGWVSGSQGSGKSTSLHTLLAEACLSGRVVPLIIDMKGGTSLTDWQDIAPWYVTDPDDALRLLRGVRALVEQVRQPLLRGSRRTDPTTREDLGVAPCLPVTPAQPLLLVIIEEAPVLWEAHPAAVALFRHLVTTTRAVQVGGWLASQATTAGAAFGGDDVIRRQVRKGNVIVHRNSASSGRETAESAVDIDPSSIPDVSGAGYVIGPADRSDLLMRARWLEYPIRAARAARVPQLPELERRVLEVAMRGPVHPDTGSAHVVDGAVVSPMERVALLRAAVAEQVGSAGETSTADVVAALAGHASRDQVERALKAQAQAGVIVDAGRGRWAARQVGVSVGG